MIIGFNKFTTKDYPGLVAAVVFFGGCNLRCPWCHNPDSVSITRASGIGVENVISFLTTRVGKLEGVVLSGGEPTIQSTLVDTAKRIKDLGFKIKLDTNGCNPDVVKSLIDENVLDMVGLDFKVPPDRFRELHVNREDWYQMWAETLKVIQDNNLPYEVRTTVHSSYFTESDAIKMARVLHERGVARWVWQKFVRPATGVLDENLPDSVYSERDIVKMRVEILEILESLGITDLSIDFRK